MLLLFLRCRMQKKTARLTILAAATRPTARPTAPPVPRPPLSLLELTPSMLGELVEALGMIVTVRTCPVMVSSEMIGVMGACGEVVEEVVSVVEEVVDSVDSVEEGPPMVPEGACSGSAW